MGYQSTSQIGAVGVSANWLARMKAGISDLIKATGAVVQTADTGQINWASAVTPTAFTHPSYEIFAFNDSLQATAPIYLKLEYGWGGNISNPSVRLSVASGTNGAGTLTGVVTALQLPLSPSGTAYTNSTTAQTIHANGSAADSALLWAGWLSGTVGGGMFLVERSRDFDGTPNSDGVLVYGTQYSSAGTNYLDCLRFTPSGITQNATPKSGGMVLLPSNSLVATTATTGGNTYFMPWYTGVYGTSIGGPSKYVVGYYKSDVGAGASITLSLYGQSNTFLAGGTGFSGNHDYLNTTASGVGLCLRVS